MAKQTLNFDLIEVVIKNDRVEKSIIGVMIARFPHLVTDIFKELDDKTLGTCRNVSRLYCEYLDSEKLLWIRMIQNYRMNMGISYLYWNRVLKNTPSELVKEFSVSTRQFFKDDVSRNDFHWSPLQIAAEQGNLGLCKYILKKRAASVIDIMIARFPHLITDIFKELDDKTLTTCRNVSRLCCDYLDTEKSLWVRMIQRYRRFTGISSPHWNKVLKNSSVEIVKELSVSTEQFFKDSRTYFRWSPLQIAADQGKLELCKHILEKNRIKYTSNLANGYNHPLFMAARKGHEEVCKVLFDNSEEKNPSDILGMTTFHFAAEKGLTDVCKLIIENITNKNPAALNGCTPLHLAAENGHFEIVRLIVETGVDKFCLFNRKTPLDLVSGELRSYALYRLLCKNKTQLCGRICNDIMLLFGLLFISFMLTFSFMIILIFPVFGDLVPNWNKDDKARQIFGPLSLGLLVSFVTIFFLIIIISLILNMIIISKKRETP